MMPCQAGHYRAVASVGFQASGDLPRCLPRWWLGNRPELGAGQF
jgi:hypothetical protein